MHVSELFLQRYRVLYDFWIDSLWTSVSPELMRQRPHPRVNSIAWVLWHLTRAEDGGLNRFVFDLPQVLDQDDWLARLNIPWRHNGNGMNFAEVDELSARIDLRALQGYSAAVRARTLDTVQRMDAKSLDATLDEARVRRLLFDEGWAYDDDPDRIQNYLGWSKGKVLMTLGLTHSFQHVGEMDVIASLLGLEF